MGEDADMVEHHLVVFDSAIDSDEGSKTIKEVLSEHPTILNHVIQDSYLYLEFKIVLKIVGGTMEA